jgi:hypothetical protein
MSWTEQDEYTETSEAPATLALPQGVAQRIVAYAERTNKKADEVKQDYLNYIKEEWGCDNPAEEDDDLLIDWAEQAFVQTRKQTGGGSNTNTWVGCFLGVADRKKDRLQNIVKSNVALFNKDPAEAIGLGRVGVFEKDGDVWAIRNKDGLTPLTNSSSEDPPFGIKTGDDWVCLLTRKGLPSSPVRMGRYAYFLGGEEGDFVNNNAVSLWKVDLTNENADMNLDIGRPCKISVVPPRDTANEYFKTVLSTYDDFSPNYTDEFLPEQFRSLLKPTNYWTMADHELFTPIDNLEEAFESRKERTEIGGRQVTYGPLIITKGTINSMNTEPRDSEYDPEGFNYNMTLSSTITGDIDCWIAGAVGVMCDPFTSGWGEEAFDYAEKSTVFVFGRVGMKDRDGLISPKISVMGIYGDPRRCRKRATGGNTGVNQFE